MFFRKHLRKALVVVFYLPFVASVVIGFLVSSLCRWWGLVGQDDEPDGNSESLSYTGMSGRFSGTVVTLFTKRIDVQSGLPPELTIVENDKLPDWLRERDDHPVILIFGKQVKLGKRMRILGRYRTVPLFRPYLETFVAIPFLKPRASRGPCPCFHFVRVPCSSFWPTELGILCMGWPKIQCPMQMSEQGQIQHYVIRDEGGRNSLLLAQTDLTDPVALDTNQDSLDEVISMLSQPLVLIKGRKLLFFSFDFRFEAAILRAVSASGTIYPGLLPSVTERMDLSFPGITDVEFGAFFLETTFLNRRLVPAAQ